MTCPICDNKPPNCDCTELERQQHEEIERLTAEVERHRMTEEERVVLEKVWPDYAANNDDAECAHIEDTIHRYLVRTKGEVKTSE